MSIMEVQVAVAKVGKYATSESGDSLEMIERPEGGLSFVLVDGQRSGKAAKNISIVVARKAISLLAEGVRDGAAARAASDYLYTYRSGKVSATLNILSIDLATKTIVITRNNPDPVVLIRAGEIQLMGTPTDPVGTRRGTRPDITEISIEENMTVIVYTDGLTHAGDRRGTDGALSPAWPAGSGPRASFGQRDGLSGPGRHARFCGSPDRAAIGRSATAGVSGPRLGATGGFVPVGRTLCRG